MADINIQMKQRNGTIWDNLYPKTLAANVTESTMQRFVSDTEKASWNGKQNALGFTPENAAVKNQANGYPGLDASGKISAGQLPAIAITDTFVVADQASMLALAAQVGDVAVRTDLNQSFILKTDPPTTLANWQQLLSPTNAVTSVAGRTGAVTLTASDVGLGNVTNESKSTMFANAALTGTPTAPTAAADTSTTQIASTAFVVGQASAMTPLMDSTAAIGTSKKYARADHIHPSDTSRASTVIATTSANGLMSSMDKNKLDSMPKITVADAEPSSPIAGDFWYAIV
jgi:hypothetical protein